MNNWLICAGSQESAVIDRYLQGCGTRCNATREPSPFAARDALKKQPLTLGVIVGEDIAGPDAINVAAAFAKDACATETVLVVKDVSGSLLSRANRAGITRVITLSELERAPYVAPALEQDDAPAVSKPQVQKERRSPIVVPSLDVSEKSGAAPELALSKRKETPVITFVSGRGGVGKSTICALSGNIAASWGMHVALLDLDLAFGNLASLCGLEHSSDLAGLVEAVNTEQNLIDSRGAKVSENLDVYGPCRAPEYAELVQPYASKLIAALTQKYDLVLIDTTTNWNDAVACAAQEADRLAIVTDERPGAISALARCGGLAVRLGVARTRIVRVMNGCDPKRRDEAFVSRAARSLECAREVKVLMGDVETQELLACGRAAELTQMGGSMVSSTATGLAQILQELGRLPACESAEQALQGAGRKTKRFFGISRKVAAL